MARELHRHRDTAAKIRALHQPVTVAAVTVSAITYCEVCREQYPCETLHLLERES